MKLRSIHLLCVGAAFLSLPDCGGQSARSGIIQSGAAVFTAGTWMKPDASKRDLVYVGNAAGAYVLSYPDGQLEGSIGPVPLVIRLCSDAKGHIFFLSGLQAPGKIYEYAHGGSESIKILNDKYGNPWGCAVDSITGDLAVTNQLGPRGAPGNLLVYENANGKPQVYSDPNLVQFLFCGYDNQGNLFADTIGTHQLVELPKNGTNLLDISANRTFAEPLSVQWDGSYITVADFKRHAIYRLTVTGSTATVVGKTNLRSWTSNSGNVGSWIQGNAVLAPTGPRAYKLGIWNYPQNGKPLAVWHFSERVRLTSVTISRASKKTE